MGLGSCWDTLDDHFGNYNWWKVSSMCGSTSICMFKLLIMIIFLAVTFLHKVKEVVPAWDEHLLAFKEFNAALPAAIVHLYFLLLLTFWYTAILEHQVWLQLAEEDKSELASGQSIVVHNNITPGMLVTQGIELETQQ
ncbi:hypothetical protein L208DRAFT_1524179, partial [Tricholoma matsutake]